MKLALTSAVAVALAAVAVAVVVVLGQQSQVGSVADLDRGDCVDAAAFLEGARPQRGALERADCEDPHDAEVLMVLELDDDQARAYEPVVPDPVCLDVLNDRSEGRIADQRLLIAGVTDRSDPDRGDALACFGFSADGERLAGRSTTR